ncbi:hypothetical protein DL768_004154 [Monosporascus sp. mg162]|nr:hypothetical protein DL768_004154 [Monosporascus sp. mg162]
MAPFWEKPMKRILKRSKEHDGQGGKPSDIITGSSNPNSHTAKSDRVVRFVSAHSEADDRVVSPTVHSITSVQQPPAAASSISFPQASSPPPTVTAPQQNSSGSVTFIPSSLRGTLWNQAYDKLKVKEPVLVDAYERILSRKLNRDEASLTALEPPRNEMEQENPEKRRSQMMQLIRLGLDKTEKEAAVKQGIDDGMQAVHSVRGIIEKAVKAAPEAALVWVGVCFVLEILANPISEAIANRSGLAYVVSRMDWYWNLSDLLLDKNRAEKFSAGLRDQLEEHVLDLYQKLFAYQIRSVYSYYRNRGVVFFRDMIKLNDWDNKLKDIKDAEDIIRKDSSQYNTQQIRSHLQDLVDTAGDEAQKLQDIYSAIQRQTAQHRKIQEEEEIKKCLKYLRATDPRHDKIRIEQTKGSLLRDSYRWILDNPNLRRWRSDLGSTMLWIKADPGKGKTMLLCGIVDELKKSTGPGLLSFFFCQATDSRINNATAVLRGLIYLLAEQQPSLTSHLRKEYDRAGKSLFEDANSWVALSGIFKNIVQDPSLKTVYLVIDALDECITDLPKLLDLIVHTSSSSVHIKWLLSSRNELHIEQKLRFADDQTRLSLELKENAKQVSRAVDAFIDDKLSRLESLQEDGGLRNRVRDILRQKANGTFLWVALVVQELEKPESWDPLQVVEEVPTGLPELYDRMVNQIQRLTERNSEVCWRMLSTATVAYRPLYLAEVGSLCGLPGQNSALMTNVRKVVAMCGSFLTVRDDQVYLIHQSAKEYLSDEARATMFPSHTKTHHNIFFRSLELMSGTLKRDMYRLIAPGFPIGQVQVPVPDPLAATRYSCVHWVDHFCDSVSGKSTRQDGDLEDVGSIYVFLKTKYLYWLEALSLCRSMSEGIISMAKLEAFIQAYASALMFSPARSLIRDLFKKEEPEWITIKPAIRDQWSACLQTLEGHSDSVNSVAFSHDSARLASASDDTTVKIWDAGSGACLQTLEGHNDSVNSVTFSYDSARLASASDDKTVKIWDAGSGAYLQTFESHNGSVRSVAFSHNSTRLASASEDKTIKIWDAGRGACLQTLEGHSDCVGSVTFSHDSARLASASDDKTIKIWDTGNGVYLQTFEGHSDSVRSVTFSHDSTRFASASDDKTVKIWDAANGACLHTLEGHSDWVSSVVFSPDSARLASASGDMTVKIWDAGSGSCLQTFEGHSDWVRSVAFSHDSARLASASEIDDKTVKIWDADNGAFLQPLEGHNDWVRSVTFSHDSAQLASASDDKTVKIWDADSGACLQTLEGHSDYVRSVVFSYNSARLASASDDRTIKIWDAGSGACLQTLEGHNDSVRSVTFSHDSAQLASASDDKTVKIWDAGSGACLQTFSMAKTLFDISFDITKSYLRTEIGTIDIRDPSDADERLDHARQGTARTGHILAKNVRISMADINTGNLGTSAGAGAGCGRPVLLGLEDINESLSTTDHLLVAGARGIAVGLIARPLAANVTAAPALVALLYACKVTPLVGSTRAYKKGFDQLSYEPGAKGLALLSSAAAAYLAAAIEFINPPFNTYDYSTPRPQS